MPQYPHCRFPRVTIEPCLRALFCILLLGLLLAPNLQAQPLSRQQLTASYLYNFAKNIHWPNEEQLEAFRIGLYGADQTPLFAELQQLNGRLLRGLPIRVESLSNANQLAAYQLVYVAPGSNRELLSLSESVAAKPVLLVTSDYPDRQWVMINLVGSGDRLLFEVNRPNLLNRGLNPLPELILNGGSEIDVARLYREGQASLADMHKQLLARERNLQQLGERTTQQEQQLQQLIASIAQSDALMAQQKQQLDEQTQLLESNKRERSALVAEITGQTRALEKQQQQLDSIGSQIAQREQRLQQLNLTILTQEEEIASQKVAITGLDQTVGAQQTALRYMLALVALALLLMASVLAAYQAKRRHNQRLAAQSKDLQIARDRLAIAKRKAEEASQAKGDFLSLMSHELRTPLQAVIGYTEVVIEELRLDNDLRHVNDLEKVIHNSERLLRLINSVLDMAKIESGKMDLDLTEVRLSSLVSEALDVVSPLLEKGKIQVSSQVDDGLTLPIADPEKLLHILINLLGNACKFATGGEVRICAEHRPSLIYISVADTGIGMTPSQQEHIFDAFRQADSGTTRKYQGSGLGLSITRQLCELMGGSIRVDSELGKGATFIIELPLPIAPPLPLVEDVVNASLVDLPAVDVLPLALDDALPGCPLLIVEADLQLFEQLARAPGAKAFQFYSANTLEDASQLLRELEKPVLIIDPLFPQLSPLLAELPALPQVRELLLWRSVKQREANQLAAPSAATQLMLARVAQSSDANEFSQGRHDGRE